MIPNTNPQPEPRAEPRSERVEVVEVVEAETVRVVGPADAGASPVLAADAPGVDPEYCEWDRGEWVGEGQEPPDAPAEPAPAETEPRWTKWQWVGEGQGEPGSRRGLPAAAMPDGENGLSGHRHNPGMAHWGGSRLGRRVREGVAVR